MLTKEEKYFEPQIIDAYARCDRCMEGISISELLDTSWDDRNVFLECKKCNPTAFAELDYIGNFYEFEIC